MNSRTIGIIGGSGLYAVEGLKNIYWKSVTTPFGNPSDKILHSEFEGYKIVFLPRHGRGHTLMPSDINYRANIYALKACEVTDIISFSACGSFREKLSPGTFVLIDQFIDRTFKRDKTFFDKGLVAHVSLANPTCNRLMNEIAKCLDKTDINYITGGTYLAMEGPQFSTLAESNLYRSWNCDVIGMTNMPEAKLAREAEMCYATIGMITDYDSWHPEHGSVNVEKIIETMNENTFKAQGLIEIIISSLNEQSTIKDCNFGCQKALENSIITSNEHYDKEVVKNLNPILKRVMKLD